MKRNKIVSILEYSVRNKMLVGILAVSLIGAGGVFLSSNATISNNTMGINKIVLAGTLNNSGNKACVINGNDSLVLYTSASQSNIQSYISVGEMLTINSYSNGYYNVTVQETGATGYIASSNMQKIVSGVGYDLTSLSGTAYTTNVSTVVNLREEATMNSTTLAKLKNNTSVELLGKQGDWYKVSDNGTTGYIYGEYIAIANTNSTSSSSSSSSTSKATGTTKSSSSSSSVKATSSKSSSNTINGTTSKTEGSSNQTSKIAYVYNLAGNGEVGVYSVPASAQTEASDLQTALESGTKITVLGSETSNGYYKIEYSNNKIGYIPAKYVSFTKPEDLSSSNSKTAGTTTKSTSSTGNGYVYIRVPRGENLHVYSTKNDLASNTVATLNGGVVKVDILSQSNGWSYITTNNVSGYVLTSALKAAENDYINNPNISSNSNKFYGGTPIRIPRGENLHVYSTKNDSNSNTVATLNGGVYKVDIQNEGNDWSYISTTNNDNVSGYVLTSALKAAENNYTNS